MDGLKADIAFTSPPYNADHLDVPLSDERGGGTQKATQKKYLADNDKRSEDEYFDFLCANIDLLLVNATETFYNIGVAAGSKTTIARLLNKYQNQFKELMYWVKDNPMPVITESVISSATELIICFGENGSRAFNHFNDRLFHGVINGHSAALSNKYADIHKATFPVYLPTEIISRFTPDNGTVIDCFGGTGTTLIACEQLNRKCYMAELDPHYCDVIINRWEQLTGEKAELITA
jgi:DNA modification methylase